MVKICTALVVIMAILSGCQCGQTRDISEYDSFEEWKKDLEKDMNEHNAKAKKEGSKYLEVAEKNAIKYIKNKYGFEPMIIEKNPEYSIEEVGGTDDGFVGWKYNFNGNVMLKFRKNEKDYYIFISGKDDNALGYDNYQYDSIVSAVIDSVEKELGVKPLSSDIKIGKSHKITDLDIVVDNLVNEKFLGTNLKTILQDSKIFLEYGGAIELQNEKWKNVQNNLLSDKIELYVVKYKSDEEYRIAKSNYDSNKSKYNNDFVSDKEFYGYDLLAKTLNIDCCLSIIKGKMNISKPQIGECDGIYIVQWGVSNSPVITKSETVDVETARKGLGELC